MTPTALADTAAGWARDAGLTVEILDRAGCAALGMGLFLAVAQGSTQEPRFVHLAWTPAGARRRVVVVGKGITFDSGGLSLKTNEGMLDMKTDMAGAAAVLAAVAAGGGREARRRGPRARGVHGEHAVGQRVQAGRRHSFARRQDGRDQQHRRGGTVDARRRAQLRLAFQTGRDARLRDADRRVHGRARAAHRRRDEQRRRARERMAGRRATRRRGHVAVAVAARGSRNSSSRRSPTSRTPASVGAVR